MHDGALPWLVNDTVRNVLGCLLDHAGRRWRRVICVICVICVFRAMATGYGLLTYTSFLLSCLLLQKMAPKKYIDVNDDDDDDDPSWDNNDKEPAYDRVEKKKRERQDEKEVGNQDVYCGHWWHLQRPAGKALNRCRPRAMACICTSSMLNMSIVSLHGCWTAGLFW